MGKPSRDKGARFERSCVKVFQAHNIPAKRVPLSGATWMKDDILVGSRNLHFECKTRGDGSGQKQIRNWLGDCYGLVIGQDRQPPLVVLRLTDFCELFAAAEKPLAESDFNKLMCPSEKLPVLGKERGHARPQNQQRR